MLPFVLGGAERGKEPLCGGRLHMYQTLWNLVLVEVIMSQQTFLGRTVKLGSCSSDWQSCPG